MESETYSQGLRAVSQETNDAWCHFVSLFRRDCEHEGSQKSHELLPARLELVNEQLFSISHAPGGAEEQVTMLISHPRADMSQDDVTIMGSFHQVGLQLTTKPPESEPFIKLELPDQTQPHSPPQFGLDFPEDRSYLERGWVGRQSGSAQVSSENPGRKRSRISSPDRLDDRACMSDLRDDVDTGGEDEIEEAESEDGSHEAGYRASPVSQSLPSHLRPLKQPIGRKTKYLTKKKVSKADMLQHWKQFEMREIAKISNLEIGYREDHILENPSVSFENLLSTQPGKGIVSTERVVSEEEAHTVVSFVTAVAGPESLIQFKQAMIGWRTRSLMTELMGANGLIPVLKALHYLDAQNAFNAIATRIKLVQLAEAVDIANLTLPAPKGRGNPIVIWLSNQYKVFLRAEYPELIEGSNTWNTKLDDIKRKVKAGRRWQHLIKCFGVGIIGLVPSFAPRDSRSYDLNKSIKSYNDPCFKLIVETLELRKGNHVRLLSAKLHEFMGRLFKGHTNLPRLVLEYMDTSQIEAQPNCSPELVVYLDIATKTLSLPSLGPAMTEGFIDYGNSDLVNSALERLGLRQENLEEFKGNNKMSGSVINSFMQMLTNEAESMQYKSLFMDSDFFPGANRCLNCRSQDQFCDMTEQYGAHCTRCRCDGVICERPKPNKRIDGDNFYRYDRIFIPVFTKEITHWSLVVIRPAEKSVVHYDSLDYPGPQRPAILTWALREVVKWVKDLISPTWVSYGWQESSCSVAKQPPGGNDCGICTVMFCRLLQTGQPFPEHGSLVPRHMAKMRSSFAKQLIDGRFSSHIPLSKEI